MKSLKKESLRDMTVGDPASLLLHFSIPLILANVLQQFCAVVDTAVVGQGAGLEAFSALGAVNGFQYMLNNVMMGLAMGYEVLFSQRYGAREERALRQGAAASLILTGGLSLGMLLLVQGMMVPVLRLMQVPESLMPQGILYLRILACGIPVSLLLYVTTAILRALGDSRTPFLSMTLMAVLNIVLDLLFVFDLQLGVAGAAYASLIAQAVSAAINFLQLLRLPALRPASADFRTWRTHSGTLLRLCMPYAVMSFLAGASIMVVQGVTNGMGKAHIAGGAAAMKIANVVFIVQQAFSYAVSVYVGQNYGAGNRRRIIQGVRAAVVMACVTAVALGVPTYLLREPLMGLFIEKTDPAEYAAAIAAGSIWMFALCSWIPMNYLIILRSAAQGMGATRIPILAGVAETVIRVVISFLAVRYRPEWICWSHSISWVGIVLVSAVGYWILIRRMPERDAAAPPAARQL